MITHEGSLDLHRKFLMRESGSPCRLTVLPYPFLPKRSVEDDLVVANLNQDLSQIFGKPETDLKPWRLRLCLRSIPTNNEKPSN